jgi:hypothetical protein
MGDNELVAELLPVSAPGSSTLDWSVVRGHLTETVSFLLTSIRPDGRPHVMPVHGIWLDGAMYLCTPEITRKARNLAGNPNCVMSVGLGTLDLIVEAQAGQVSDDDELRAVGDAYAAKYQWKVTVADGTYLADNGSGLGEIPFGVFRLAPTTVYALNTDRGFAVTRWRF